MFKSFGNLLHKTPWWGLILFGISVLIGLALFATPVHVMRLAERGSTPEERTAIQREIRIAFGDSALNIAEEVISAVKSHSEDGERNAEFAKALREISKAREQLSRAQAEGADFDLETAQEAAQEAKDNALELAQNAAESALETARDARRAIEESRDESIERLRDKKLDIAATVASFNELLKSARANEEAAQKDLESIKKLSQQVSDAPASPATPKAPTNPSVPAPPSKPSLPRAPTSPPAPPAIPAPPTPPAPIVGQPSQGSSTLDAQSSNDGTIVLGGVRFRPGHVPEHVGSGVVVNKEGRVGLHLPPEFRGDIRTKVAGDVWRIGVGSVLILAFIPLFFVLVLAKFFIGRSRRALAFAEEKEKQAEMSDMSRQVTEARLQALQAQVEPHFLYNTLANVQALTEVDPPAANRMVGHLIQYLRAALPKMRESTSTIGQELELVRAYLNILKMRMGDRLDFGITAPDDLLKHPFPPMMLPSLVENAIKHGLEPQREGGRIDVVVSRTQCDGAEKVCVQVFDTGRGLTDEPIQVGGGVGLSNLRERLWAIYGGLASFRLESNQPQGVVASVCVPPGASADLQTFASPSVSQTQSVPNHPTGWRRIWHVTSRTHGVWANLLIRVFFALVVVSLAAMAVSFVALYTGWMPVQLGDFELDGVEGLALGSIGLLIAFAVTVFVIGLVLALMYGLGFLFVGLLVFIPLVIMISVFPVLAPFLLIWLVIYMFWKRRH